MFTGYVITYPCWYSRQTMLVKQVLILPPEQLKVREEIIFPVTMDARKFLSLSVLHVELTHCGQVKPSGIVDDCHHAATLYLPSNVNKQRSACRVSTCCAMSLQKLFPMPKSSNLKIQIQFCTFKMALLTYKTTDIKLCIMESQTQQTANHLHHIIGHRIHTMNDKGGVKPVRPIGSKYETIIRQIMVQLYRLKKLLFIKMK